VLVRTLYISVVVTVVCLLIAFPVAYHLARTQSRMRGVLFACILSPLLVTAVIRCYGWIIILSNNGVINSSLKQWGLIERPVPLMYNELGVSSGWSSYVPFMVRRCSAPQSIIRARRGGTVARGQALTVMCRVVVLLAMPGVQSV
jgi:putative spermidine/putrescine transport system permease protein